jgi:hypothetical protein
MRLMSRSGLIATALAVGAFAAPAAQAGGLMSTTAPDPPGAAQQEAQSFLRIYSHQASTPSAVVPNPDEQLPASTPTVATPHKATVARDQLGDRRLSAAFVRIAQIDGRNITPTTTTAVSTGAYVPGDAVVPRFIGPPEARLFCAPRSAPRFRHPISSTPTSTASHSPGFQYDDAAIGAGVMVGLVLVGTAGALGVRRRGQLRHA